MAFDLPALAIGFAAVAMLPVAVLAPSAWRAARAIASAGSAGGGLGVVPAGAARPSRLAAAGGHAGWATCAVGLRMAFEPGRGRTAVPVRTALAGTTVAIGAVAAAFIFAASLLGLVGTPGRYGQNWDANSTLATPISPRPTGRSFSPACPAWRAMPPGTTASCW